MGDPYDPEKEARRLSLAAQEALGRLKRNADYPRIHLLVIEEVEALDKSIGVTLPSPALPSSARLDFAIKIMDVHAGGYIGLVSTIADHDDFQTLLRNFERKAWENYRGLAEIEPLGIGINKPFAAIRDRSMYWYKESLRRLIRGEKSKVMPPQHRRGYRKEIRAWMKENAIGSVRLAAKKLGVSDSTLKSIMSNTGTARYSHDTLDRILGEIGCSAGGE